MTQDINIVDYNRDLNVTAFVIWSMMISKLWIYWSIKELDEDEVKRRILNIQDNLVFKKRSELCIKEE